MVQSGRRNAARARYPGHLLRTPATGLTGRG